MAKSKHRTFWRIVRRVFRWSRISVWMLLLIALVAVTYLTTIGLPDFLKKPLLQTLREKGWEVQFSQMRWGWYRGVIIQDATFSRTNENGVLEFSTRQAELDLSLSALKKSELKLKSISIDDGKLSLPTPRNPLTFSGIKTELRFLPGDTVSLAPSVVQFHGTKIQISGTLANASALRELKPPSEKSTNETARVELEKFLAFLEQIEFSETPEISLKINTDARDFQHAQGSLQAAFAGARTPWGTFENVKIGAQLNAENETNPAPSMLVNVTSGKAKTPWIFGSDFNGRVSIRPLTNSGLIEIETRFSANQMQAQWPMAAPANFAKAATAQFNSRSLHSKTNFSPLNADGKLRILRGDFRGRMFSTNAVATTLPEADLVFHYDTATTNSAEAALKNLPEIFSTLQPLDLAWRVQLRDLRGADLKIQTLANKGRWHFPMLTISDFNAQLHGGFLRTGGSLNVTNRALKMSVDSDFDFKNFQSLLPVSAQQYSSRLKWETAPKIKGDIALILPEWKNAPTNWVSTILPSLDLNARLTAGPFQYDDISASSLSADFAFKNSICSVTNLHLVRSDGDLTLDFDANLNTGRYRLKTISALDPSIVRSQLSEDLRVGFDSVQFKEPPKLEAELRGRWGENPEFAAHGKIVATNFVARGEHFDHVDSVLDYTNGVIRLSDVHALRHSKSAHAPKIEISIPENRIFFTDVEGDIDPLAITRAIGRVATEAIEDYKFTDTPFVRVNGQIAFDQIDDCDLRFNVKGKEFRWGLFHADAAAVDVIWQGQYLYLTNGIASAYNGGTLHADASFDFTPKGKANYRFSLDFANVNVQSLAASLQKPSEIEGILNGQLEITSADTLGLASWQGRGQMHLRDGLIWKIPVFGMFSPMLDAIAPGLGKSRVREASATFVIANGVAYSNDLEMRSPTLRMQYRGTVDYEKQVNARVEAELLRDTWGIGRAVSLMLTPLTKLFEFRVTGTIEDPKSEPVYIPKFLMMTLRPFHTIKTLLPEKNRDTQAPAKTE